MFNKFLFHSEFWWRKEKRWILRQCVALYVQLALKAARTTTEHEPHKLCMSLSDWWNISHQSYTRACTYARTYRTRARTEHDTHHSPLRRKCFVFEINDTEKCPRNSVLRRSTSTTMPRCTGRNIAGSACGVHGNGTNAHFAFLRIQNCSSPMEFHTLGQLMNNGNEPSPLPTRNWTRNWKKMPP